MNQFSRYRPLVGKLALKALTAAAEVLEPLGGRHDARLGLPAAQRLLSKTPKARLEQAESRNWWQGLTWLCEVDASVDASERPLRTPGGQWRDVYHPMIVHLYLRSFEQVRSTLNTDEAAAYEAALVQVVKPLRETKSKTISHRLWRALCLYEHDRFRAPDEPSPSEALVDQLINRDDRGRPAEALHAQDESEPLDFWTYRELAGLHALARLALISGRASWRSRVKQIANFHLYHTQPDYTTYEPWALFAFADSTETALFAEQQLHDAVTHLGQNNADTGLMVGLLLADAFDAMYEPGTDRRLS